MTTVTLDAAQLARLEAAFIRYPSRQVIDRDGNTRTTNAVIDQFVASLLAYHRKHGYLTAKQFSAVKNVVGEPQPPTA
jgi:hypothetical protein